MDTTYLYTKRFIDQEVRRLSQPLVVTSKLESILTEESEEDDPEGRQVGEKQLQQIISKVNVLIKRHNRNVFSRQVVNQMIQQVIKCEQNKLMVVNDKLMRIEMILKPILLPEVSQTGNVKTLMGEFGELVRELPESKYLFEQDDEYSADEKEETPDNTPSDEERILVQDEEERVEDDELTKSQYNHRLRQQTEQEQSKKHNTQLLQKYDGIRHHLIELHRGLEYKYAKLEYLNQLKKKLLNVLLVPEEHAKRGAFHNNNEAATNDDEPFDSDDDANDTLHHQRSLDYTTSTSLSNEINKFRVLVEKISYRLHSKQELQATLDSINSQ
ncbi:uncharacterized protein AC631_05279 [Debaryomyces fabryi]|uniref:Uncharacterized protein n=1 Tax=Debaryomyces fabryi TaxID=58627 RepID=A0A0V1PRV3_9ASCO|nr:uncharacterized protein AC631_05279 [Debaryomyces fabryi]KRZ98960.1 hypothetical protein AC631_05279 [Debaryomyces fabryi]CUM46685.1 unnamed protein product [Debaryomyces fabryi]